MRDAKEVAEDVIRLLNEDDGRPLVNIIYHTILADRREVWAEAMRRAKEKIGRNVSPSSGPVPQGSYIFSDKIFAALDELEKEGPDA